MRRILEVNVLGALLCAREAARRLARSRGGRGGSIVLVSSAAARLGSPHEYVDYAASKGAVESLGVGLAKELAHDGVRVNVVRPGIIETDIHAAGGDPDRAARLTPSIPLRRPGTGGRGGGRDPVAARRVVVVHDRFDRRGHGRALNRRAPRRRVASRRAPLPILVRHRSPPERLSRRFPLTRRGKRWEP